MGKNRTLDAAKSILKRALEIEEYYAQFPGWYWKSGLHDAQILSVSEKELVPDYKDKNPKWNCLEILLDSKNALYENDVKKICLYNYKIKTPDFDIKSLKKNRWTSDTLKQAENGRYLSEIETETSAQEQIKITVSYEFAEVERKQKLIKQKR